MGYGPSPPCRFYRGMLPAAFDGKASHDTALVALPRQILMQRENMRVARLAIL
jgi:hypothetical protein